MTSVSMPVSFGPAAYPTSTTRPATVKPTRAAKATKAAKTSLPKEAKGPNSDHRKEQNRIASKNYREKRKQKLALLRQILDEPAEGSTDKANVDANANVDVDAQSAAPAAPTYSVTAFPDALPVVFPGFDNNFQPDMLTDLLSTDTLAVPSTQPATIASPAPLTSAAGTSYLWNAAESASPSNPFSWIPAEPSLPPATTATTTSNPLSMPLLNSWTVPFASDFAASFPPPPPATSSSTTPLPLPSLPSLSSVTPASSTPSDTIDNFDSLSHFDLDQTLNPTLDLNVGLDLDQMMRSDLQAASFFNGLTTDTACNFSQSKPKHRPAQIHATLPSRPSPQALWASLAQSDDPSNTYPPAPVKTNSASTTTDTANKNTNLTGPSRRTRKKNKPVVRAMLQYVQTLSSHQKRLILQALLDEGEGMPGDAERVGEVEEVDDVDDMDEDDNNDENDDDSPSSHYTSTTTPDAGATAMKTLRAERRREVASRWNASTKEKAFASAAAAYTNISMSSLGAEYQAFAAGFSSTSPAARAQLPPTFMTMTLQCRRLTFCVAILQNCEACGLPNPTALLDESCAFEDADGNSGENLQSPFALAADDARAVVTQGPARIAAVVAAVRQQMELRGKTPPKDLQPTDAQILVAHHPYIDTIPFRGFRARALALLAQMEADECIAEAAQQSAMLFYGGAHQNQSEGATPCLLDEDELCYDMNVADGLICWGSQIGNDGMGLSAQAMRDSSTARDMRAGVPWDMRSWEPQVWFLKKYWYLVGGWDDDMWRNCRWWHSMRGEDLDYSVFAAPGY